MPLEPLLDNAAWEWLRPYAESYLGTVRGLVSDRYSSYCKLFHPYIQDLSPQETIASHYGTERNRHGRIIDRVWTRDLQRLGYGAMDASFPFRRLKVREIAERAGLTVSAEFSVWSVRTSGYQLSPDIIAPYVGVLPQHITRRLVAILDPFTAGQWCNFYWSVYPPDLRDVAHPRVYRGMLRDAAEILNTDEPNRGPMSPNYWWPEDRTWLVATDLDLTFTVIAGSEALITQLLEDSELETIRVTPDTRVDLHADDINQ